MVKIEDGKRGKQLPAAAVGSSLSYNDSDVGNTLPAFTPRSEPGFHLGVQSLRNTLVSPLDFFHMYFTPGLVDDIVQHTNTYAYIAVANENSSKRYYTESDWSWRDTTPDDILRLIGLLIYFGFVDIKGSANWYWSTTTLFHGLWVRSFMSGMQFRALMALLHVVDLLNGLLVINCIRLWVLLIFSRGGLNLYTSQGNVSLLMSAWSSPGTDQALDKISGISQLNGE